MDQTIVNLAIGVMTVLTPYLAKGGAEGFAKGAGQAAFKKAEAMLATLKARWAGDEEASQNLARFEEKPERYAPVVEDILLEKLAEDEELAADLTRLLNELGPKLKIFQEMEEAKGVVGLRAKQFRSGEAEIRQKADKAEDVTGADIDTIG